MKKGKSGLFLMVAPARGTALSAEKSVAKYKKPGMLSGANGDCLSRWGRASANVRCAVKILSMRRLASGIALIAHRRRGKNLTDNRG